MKAAHSDLLMRMLEIDTRIMRGGLTEKECQKGLKPDKDKMRALEQEADSLRKGFQAVDNALDEYYEKLNHVAEETAGVDKAD